MKNLLTREQAVALVGEEFVAKVDAENCEPTNMVGYNGSCQNDSEIEWAANISLPDSEEGFSVYLTAYYYTNEEQEAIAKEHGWDAINWEVAGYEVR